MNGYRSMYATSAGELSHRRISDTDVYEQSDVGEEEGNDGDEVMTSDPIVMEMDEDDKEIQKESVAGLLGAATDKRSCQREIGKLARWSLSSCKSGYGIDAMRDDNTETFWQSDGPQPHLINIQFSKRTPVEEIAFYLDYKQDESYSPNKILIRAGTNYHDLQEIHVLEMEEPEGWVSAMLCDGEGQTLHTYHLQIAIVSNHQNGRDSHIRQIKVFAPRKEYNPSSDLDQGGDDYQFTSDQFRHYSHIR